jgi:hypothetical protein
MKRTDRLWSHFFQKPLAWLLAALLVLVVYMNYREDVQLATVCDVIESPHGAIDKPKTLLERAQSVCDGRFDEGNTPEE